MIYQASYKPIPSNPPTPILVERSSAGAQARGATPVSTPGSSLRNSSILASSSASHLISNIATAASKKITPLSGGFLPYDAGEDEIITPTERELGISAPEPIKVVKVKKKKVSAVTDLPCGQDFNGVSFAVLQTQSKIRRRVIGGRLFGRINLTIDLYTHLISPC